MFLTMFLGMAKRSKFTFSTTAKGMGYYCSECGHKCKSNSNLIKHMESAHGIVEWHECEHCVKKYKRSGNLRRHKAIIHNIGGDSEKTYKKRKIFDEEYGNFAT